MWKRNDTGLLILVLRLRQKQKLWSSFKREACIWNGFFQQIIWFPLTFLLARLESAYVLIWGAHQIWENVLAAL